MIEKTGEERLSVLFKTLTKNNDAIIQFLSQKDLKIKDEIYEIVESLDEKEQPENGGVSDGNYLLLQEALDKYVDYVETIITFVKDFNSEQTLNLRELGENRAKLNKTRERFEGIKKLVERR
jgi:hypothetical protein